MSHITLRPDTPLSFLNDHFPQGIPVSSSLVSINGIDCFEFRPEFLPTDDCKERIGKAIVSSRYSQLLLYGLCRYGTVLIPCELEAQIHAA